MSAITADVDMFVSPFRLTSCFSIPGTNLWIARNNAVLFGAKMHVVGDRSEMLER